MQTELEQALRELPRIGKLIKDYSYRQVWRFECAGKVLYLKFYPRAGVRNWLRRMVRGNNALREFDRLRWLAKAGVPAPRAIGSLIGYTLNGRKGDAVIMEGIEPAVPLDRYLHDLAQRGQAVPHHAELISQLADLLEHLGKAGLGHSDLHLGNLLLKEGKLYLLDGAAVHRNGLRMEDIELLALSARPHVTRTDLHRIWRRLMPDVQMPKKNRLAASLWRKAAVRAFDDDRFFGHIESAGWTGHFFRQAKFPSPCSPASRLVVSERDWQEAWPLLLKQMESDQFEVLKRCSSGDVLAGDIVLGGRPVSVVIKRPWRKFWYRHITEIGRGTRPRRAWAKAWKLVVRGIPTAWPLLMMEKRRFGHVIDAVIIFERIQGKMLVVPDWSQRGREAYHQLLHRVGRLLRQLEESGMFLHDAKAYNWMVREDEKRGPTPMLIDVDGLRWIKVSTGGFNRLLRSLRECKEAGFDDVDALALARGYMPFASIAELERLCGLSPGRALPQAAEGMDA